MAGTPIVTLVNLGQVYLRAFVPEGSIGRVRVGSRRGCTSTRR
jgi:multidrug resistance efflux pump